MYLTHLLNCSGNTSHMDLKGFEETPQTLHLKVGSVDKTSLTVRTLINFFMYKEDDIFNLFLFRP